MIFAKSSSKSLTDNETSGSDIPVLFNYFRSSCAWRVRIVLEYKGIKYSSIPVQLMRKEQLNAEYLRINPIGQVPALIINGVTLLQSIAISEYIEEVYSERPLLPKDPITRAKVREICALIASGIQPLQNLAVLHKYSDQVDKKLEWAQFWIRRGLLALEKVLQQSSGRYCVGDEITMADCFLVPQVANAYRFSVDAADFPICIRINETLAEDPAFKRAHASSQPDCPPEMYSKI